MNERSAGFFVQVILVINLVTAQIQFPDENYEQLVADLTAIRVDKANPPQQQNIINAPSYPQIQNAPYQQNQQNFVYQQNPQNVPLQLSKQNSPPHQQNQHSSSHRKNPQNPPRQQNQNPPRQQNPSHQQNEQDIPKSVAHGFTKLILDVNRVAPTTSPYLTQADNVVYGPVTIAGALAMVLLASIGQTFDEIANVLGLSSGFNIQNDPLYVQEQISLLFSKMETTTGLNIGHRVHFATAIFAQQDFPIRPVYQRASELLYQSNIMNLDFKGNPDMTMNVINTWVSGRTNGKIPTLLAEPPPANTKAIIASVLYFQAAWEFPFFEGGTQWRPFYVNGRKSRSDRMALMMSNGGDFPYCKDTQLGVEIMGFPYKGKATTMYVIMPIQSNKEKLQKLENSLTPADIDHLVNCTTYTEAVVLFPKMKLESTIDLRPTLQRLGVNSMFNPNLANLALLSPGKSQRFNGPEAPFVSAPIPSPNANQRPPPFPQQEENLEDRLIFNRFGDSANCIQVLDPITNVSKCEPNATPLDGIPMPLSARAGDFETIDEMRSLRQQLIRNPTLANPGLYADQVIHKVYMDITESGTEAAAATGISLNRSGDRVTFRVDIPFLFFIYHEETKVILFWGSVKSPTPTVANST